MTQETQSNSYFSSNSCKKEVRFAIPKPSSPNDLLYGISDMFCGKSHNLYDDINLNFSGRHKNGWDVVMNTIFDHKSPRHIILSEQMQLQRTAETEEKLRLESLKKFIKKPKRKCNRKGIKRIQSFWANDTNDLLEATPSLKMEFGKRHLYKSYKSPTTRMSDPNNFTDGCKLPEIKESRIKYNNIRPKYNSPKDLKSNLKYIDTMKSLLEDKLKSPSLYSDSGSNSKDGLNKQRMSGSHSPITAQMPLHKFQFPLRNRGERAKALKDELFKPKRDIQDEKTSHEESYFDMNNEAENITVSSKDDIKEDLDSN